MVLLANGVMVRMTMVSPDEDQSRTTVNINAVLANGTVYNHHEFAQNVVIGIGNGFVLTIEPHPEGKYWYMSVAPE